MKLISLWEPWATLMAIGAKKIETRDWGTEYRGLVAIHACKGGLTKHELWSQCQDPVFYRALGWEDSELHRSKSIGESCATFNFGCILAVGLLTSSRSVVNILGKYYNRDRFMIPPPEPEYSFGNYEVGRYGLGFENVIALPNPIPFKSRQGKLLDLDLETAVLRNIRSQIPSLDI